MCAGGKQTSAQRDVSGSHKTGTGTGAGAGCGAPPSLALWCDQEEHGKEGHQE